jgi:hypothetical protein
MKLHTDTPLAAAMRAVLDQLEARVEFNGTVPVYLAGGLAVHLYTGARVTTDIDAEFGVRRFSPPADLSAEFLLDDGQTKRLYIDTNYNPTFALLHEDYDKAAIASGMTFKHLELKLLSPTDLAVSKIARFQAHDREDIRALVQAGLTSSGEIQQRASEALVGFVGEQRLLQLNLRDAVRIALEAEVQPSPAFKPDVPRG